MPFIGALVVGPDSHGHTPAVDRGATKPGGTHARLPSITVCRLCGVFSTWRRSRWRDEHGLTWLDRVPEIVVCRRTAIKRQPWPMTWDEQDRFVCRTAPSFGGRWRCLPSTPDAGIARSARLRWDWEVQCCGARLQLGLHRTGGCGEEQARSAHCLEPHRIGCCHRPARWASNPCVPLHGASGDPHGQLGVVRRTADAPALSGVRVHDLKHTFGRRLRAAGVSFEDRQDLLGHKSQRVTTHYSAADLTRLIEAADGVCDANGEKPDLVILEAQASGCDVHKTYTDTRIFWCTGNRVSH